MDLIKITDLTGRMDISSRSLRYYEQMGLIKSIRLPFQKYRYYDEANIERLKQILVLRKMQIPVKDILHIYESEDMSVVVETFVNRLQDIDREVHALSRLKSIVNEFLQAMISHGITKISALPLLYEEMDRQLEVMDKHEPATYAELSDIAERLHEDVPVSIVDLPSMRMLSSQRRDGRRGRMQTVSPTGFLFITFPGGLPEGMRLLNIRKAAAAILCFFRKSARNSSMIHRLWMSASPAAYLLKAAFMWTRIWALSTVPW